MKVLFVCGREPEYIRNRIVLRILKRDFQVIEVTDSSLSFFYRQLKVILKILTNIWRSHDLVFVGFYGYPLLPIIKLLTRKPIIFDAFVSTYDTLCFDRKLFGPRSIGGRLVYLFDKLTLALADRILVDTYAHANYFAKLYGLPKKKLSVFYLGYDDTIFNPSEISLPEIDSKKFLVFYYGSFLPLQGIEYIIRAAKLLEHEKDIRFEVVGKGRTYKGIRHLADSLHLTNIEFIDWIPYYQLPKAISRASICLGGHFSSIGKAERVIAGKTYQFLAMAKPTIVGDNSANRELFSHEENVYMCRMADEKALADAIMVLKDDGHLRQEIATGGFQLMRDRFDIEALSQNLMSIVEQEFSS